MFPIDRVAEIVAGTCLRESPARFVRAIHDSRQVQEGDIFVALPGQHVDGHQFLREAFERGASGALVSRTSPLPENARNVVVVQDTLRALQALASAWRDTLDAHFIAITGTNGKTTAKGLLAHLLSPSLPTFVAPGNFNTEIGLPLALLSMPESSAVGVFEMGAERPGDIAFLSRILRPDDAVITSVGHGHLEGLGAEASVAREKWTLVEGLQADSHCYFNADAPYLLDLARNAQVPCVGVHDGDGLHGFRVEHSVPELRIRMPDVPLDLQCPLLGAHNAVNLVLAATVARALGVAPQMIEERVQGFVPQAHRLQALKTPLGTVLDDTYNANPESTAGALRVLADYPPTRAERIFIFGDMMGLGSESEFLHRETAEHAQSLPIDAIIPVGDRAADACHAIHDVEIISIPREDIPSFFRARARGRRLPLVILVKGSRALHLEDLVRLLEEAPAG